MFKILNQPYPLQEITPKTWLNCFFEGVFVALFLIVFQPFDISLWHDPHKIWYLCGFGVVTFICSAIFRFGIRSIFSNFFQEKNWTVEREIICILCMILLIATGNYLYNFTIFSQKFTLYGFFWMLVVTFIIGIFPTIFGVLTNYIYQLKKYKETIVVHSQSIDNQVVTKNNFIKFIAENEKDTLEIAENDLLFIESSDNYSTIFFMKNNKLQKELLRSSLSRLEGQIHSSAIVRCHRSFIVNLSKVERVTGNAQGYKLHLQLPELLVPVARKYSEIIENLR